MNLPIQRAIGPLLSARTCIDIDPRFAFRTAVVFDRRLRPRRSRGRIHWPSSTSQLLLIGGFFGSPFPRVSLDEKMKRTVYESLIWCRHGGKHVYSLTPSGISTASLSLSLSLSTLCAWLWLTGIFFPTYKIRLLPSPIVFVSLRDERLGLPVDANNGESHQEKNSGHTQKKIDRPPSLLFFLMVCQNRDVPYLRCQRFQSGNDGEEENKSLPVYYISLRTLTRTVQLLSYLGQCRLESYRFLCAKGSSAFMSQLKRFSPSSIVSISLLKKKKT